MTHLNTLQHNAAHCNTLQHMEHAQVVSLVNWLGVCTQVSDSSAGDFILFGDSSFFSKEPYLCRSLVIEIGQFPYIAIRMTRVCPILAHT